MVCIYCEIYRYIHVLVIGYVDRFISNSYLDSVDSRFDWRLIKISIHNRDYDVGFADTGTTRATSRITSRALDKKQISIANLGFHKRLLSGMQSSQLVLFLSPISLIAYLRSCCNGRLCNCC